MRSRSPPPGPRPYGGRSARSGRHQRRNQCQWHRHRRQWHRRQWHRRRWRPRPRASPCRRVRPSPSPSPRRRAPPRPPAARGPPPPAAPPPPPPRAPPGPPPPPPPGGPPGPAGPRGGGGPPPPPRPPPAPPPPPGGGGPPPPVPASAPPPPEAEPAVPRLSPDEAFDALYAHSAPGLVRQTYLLTGRRSLARESVERAFQLAWHRWPEVAVDRDPVGWVRAAAYEYAMSPWHRLRRVHRHPDAPPSEPARRALFEALLDLPPAYRRTLLLYDGVGLDLPETAAETEASTPAAAGRLEVARAAVAERLPELAAAASPAEQSELLQDRLGGLARAEHVPAPSPARTVRTGSEDKARLWTRAAIAFVALLIGATALTLHTAPTHYEQPVSPPERVGGVPPRGGPQKLTPQDLKLQKVLKEQLAHGPERLVPRIP
ncbi:DNA-directed RNA polymerase sigma-70 factor [Streptomyces microflavus]